jgi:hypothetical protein
MLRGTDREIKLQGMQVNSDSIVLLAGICPIQVPDIVFEATSYFLKERNASFFEMKKRIYMTLERSETFRLEMLVDFLCELYR